MCKWERFVLIRNSCETPSAAFRNDGAAINILVGLHSGSSNWIVYAWIYRKDKMRILKMKNLLLTSVAALLLATGTTHACED